MNKILLYRQFLLSEGFDFSHLKDEQIEDISFKFRSKKVPLRPGILSHDIITIEVWNIPSEDENGNFIEKQIQFQPFHLIYGESSLSIFDVFGVEETAGLRRSDCINHLEKLASEGKSEMWDGAFIAGLTNWAGDQLYCFYNASRMKFPGYAMRLLPHESLHLARNLISLEANEFMRLNQGKDKWYEDPRAKWTNLDDSNEEYFAETLERCTAICADRWDRIKDLVKITSKTNTIVTPSTNNTQAPDITQGRK